MANYDFLSIDDKEFEQLVAALLGAEEGVRYERFKPGKDAGVDGRYFSPSGTVILQCKHWARTGVAPLLKALANTEQSKVTKLAPSRYILATSLALSAADKKKIAAIFSSCAMRENDVIGNEDLNDLLERHPEIEKATTKLWLHSATILTQIANAAIRGRSQYSLQEIHKNRARYVETAAHQQAMHKLSDNNVVLITGEPGIGKTTLAEQLCLDYVVRGYQLCVAARDIDELEAIYINDAKQIFYFDDFLGRTFLEAIDRHEDSHIVGFIKRVRSDNSKRFILTSRTTILNRGKAITDIFRIEKIERHELELTIANLESIDKARILHSSIWFSGLSPEFVDVITGNKNYRKIIRHANFNPRLISFVTDPARLLAIVVENYWDFLLGMLNNPADIWGHVYDQQITDCQRVIVMLVVFGGREIGDSELREAYRRLLLDPVSATFRGDHDYDRNVQVLVGSLVNRTLGEKQAVYTLFNPSIADYVVPRLASDRTILPSIFAALNNLDAVRYFGRIIALNKIKRPVVQATLARLARNISAHPVVDPEIPLNMEIIDLAIQHVPDYDETSTASLFLLTHLRGKSDRSIYLGSAANMLAYCLSLELIDMGFVIAFTDDLTADSFDLEDVRKISSLAASMANDADRTMLVDIFHPISVEVVGNYIADEVREREVLSGFYDAEDTTEAEGKLMDAISTICSEFGVSPSAVDIQTICREVDLSDIIEDNIQRSMNEREDDDDDRSIVRGDTGIDAIDDLFNMDTPPIPRT